MGRQIKEKTSKHHKSPLCRINKPEASLSNTKQTYDRIACVFQGGGALGAYQVGAFCAIHEKGYHPNFLAGVSIGAINSAIIAGNPRNKQIEKLTLFWNTIVPQIWTDVFYDAEVPNLLHHLHNRVGAMHTVFNGLDGFLNLVPFHRLR